MAGMYNVNITVLNGQVQRPSGNNDGISGILSYNASVTGNTFVKYNSHADIVNDGYTETAYPLEWYQSKTFFEQNGEGTLWLGIVPTGTTLDFAEIATFQQAANGDVRNLLILTHDKLNVLDSGDTAQAIADIKTQCEALVTSARPLLSVILSPDVDGDLDNLISLVDGTYNNRWLMVIIGGDGDNKGAEIETTLGYTVSAGGAVLGCISRTDVAQDVSQPGLFNLTNDSADFINPKIGSTMYTDLTNSELNTINDKGYMFIRKITDYSGSFINQVRTVTIATDDYTQSTVVRTLYKALRVVRAGLVPLISSKVKQVNGQLTVQSAFIFQNAAETPLKAMIAGDELSTATVYVPTNQNVVSTGTLNITITLGIIGAANNISITLGISA